MKTKEMENSNPVPHKNIKEELADDMASFFNKRGVVTTWDMFADYLLSKYSIKIK